MAKKTTENPHGLEPFEGNAVVATSLSIRNTGDGLSKAMKVAPVELHVGDYVPVVLMCDVTAVNFPDVSDSQGVERVHVLRAREGMLIDQDLISDAMNDMRERIRVHEEQEAGQLPMGDVSEAASADAKKRSRGGLKAVEGDGT